MHLYLVGKAFLIPIVSHTAGIFNHKKLPSINEREHQISVLVEQVADLISDTAELITEVIKVYLCLNAVDDILDLVIGKINAENALNCLDRVSLELCSEILIALHLFNEFFDLCFDIHSF